ncbi:MAG: UbiA-like polyprenyltransferase, partial [Rikenellaceae bacterium]
MIKKYLSLVKFSHTIFALPFALIGFAYGVYQTETFSLRLFALMLMCMIFARNTAMSFNRYVDRDIDAKNARTASREIPSGAIEPRSALIFIIINAIMFVITTYFINPMTFMLSPVALIVICGYSLTKRFTALCHVVLGISLSIAPVGAYIAVSGEFTAMVIAIALLVIVWVGGFDILYSLSDEQFDRNNSLHSIPEFMGRKAALITSGVLHTMAIAITFIIGVLFLNTPIYYVGATIFSLILIYEHIVVKPSDITRVNLAFATLNGCGSVLYSCFTIISL